MEEGGAALSADLLGECPRERRGVARAPALDTRADGVSGVELVRALVNQVDRDAVERNQVARLRGEAGVNVLYLQRGRHHSADCGERGVLRGEALGFGFGGGVLGVEARVDYRRGNLRRHLLNQVAVMLVVCVRLQRAQVQHAEDLILEDDGREDDGLQPGAHGVGESVMQGGDVALEDERVAPLDAVADHRPVHRDDAPALAPRRGDAENVVVGEGSGFGVVHADGDAVEGDEAADGGGEAFVNVVYVERGREYPAHFGEQGVFVREQPRFRRGDFQRAVCGHRLRDVVRVDADLRRVRVYDDLLAEYAVADAHFAGGGPLAVPLHLLDDFARSAEQRVAESERG